MCAEDCTFGEDCEQNVGSVVSKMSLGTACGVPKSRNVNDSDRRALKVLLKECQGQESMRQEGINSSQHCFFSNIDQITCFSDRIIGDTVSLCGLLFSERLPKVGAPIIGSNITKSFENPCVPPYLASVSQQFKI